MPRTHLISVEVEEEGLIRVQGVGWDLSSKHGVTETLASLSPQCRGEGGCMTATAKTLAMVPSLMTVVDTVRADLLGLLALAEKDLSS